MHLYYIYGFKVISDILLVNATHYAGQAYKSELYLEYIDITNVGTTWRPTLLRKNDEHILSLGDHVIYYISALTRIYLRLVWIRLLLSKLLLHWKKNLNAKFQTQNCWLVKWTRQIKSFRFCKISKLLHKDLKICKIYRKRMLSLLPI